MNGMKEEEFLFFSYFALKVLDWSYVQTSARKMDSGFIFSGIAGSFFIFSDANASWKTLRYRNECDPRNTSRFEATPWTERISQQATPKNDPPMAQR